MSSRRAGFIDCWRGLSVCLMVLMHTMYQLEHTWGIRMWVLHWSWYPALHLLFSGSFIFIAGLCCRLTASNARRGFEALGWAAVITAVTLVATPAAPIYFGVLHCLGVMMLIYSLLERGRLGALVENPCTAPLWLGLFALCFVWRAAGHTGTWLTLPFGMPPPGTVMGDYYPLIPYLPLFFAGSSLGGLLRDGRGPKVLYTTRIPLLNYVGERALAVYILHLPAVFLLLLILFGRP